MFLCRLLFLEKSVDSDLFFSRNVEIRYSLGSARFYNRDYFLPLARTRSVLIRVLANQVRSAISLKQSLSLENDHSAFSGHRPCLKVFLGSFFAVMIDKYRKSRNSIVLKSNRVKSITMLRSLFVSHGPARLQLYIFCSRDGVNRRI